MKMRKKYYWGDRVFLVQNAQRGDNAAYKRLKKGEFAEYQIEYVREHRKNEPPLYAVRYVKDGRVSTAYYSFLEPELSSVPEAPAPLDMAQYM